MAAESLLATIRRLAGLPHETECVEFKESNASPEEIGQYLSALANAAALHREPQSYLVWGVSDTSHELVGTAFLPRRQKVQGEEPENWLLIHLHPQIHFRIREADEGGKHFVLFEIPPAAHTPVRFRDTEYIRVGTYKKKLRDHPEMERTSGGFSPRLPSRKGSPWPTPRRTRSFPARLPELFSPNEAAASRQPHRHPATSGCGNPYRRGWRQPVTRY